MDILIQEIIVIFSYLIQLIYYSLRFKTYKKRKCSEVRMTGTGMNIALCDESRLALAGRG
jgi:hypothetical protein